ncbi:MAG TPA: FHA domain-containing protein [Gemmatimonadales bacterium]|jgi:pSer/pThr/pTyr-binding forkhead associated (FHA) protein|nr:FHA domain-containing protein [Gemmatimonadales bacterium]
MALFELGGRRFTIPAGDGFLGSDPGCVIGLTGPGVLPRHAKLKALSDGQVVITKAVPEADVLINGVRLGAEPTPLLHGDKVEVAGQELTFVDERRSGSTQYVQAMSLPQAMEHAKTEAKGRATGNTGGRIVSLTDGREYAITGASLVFGRDAACDVVVAGKDVSRRHGEIVQTPKGYLLVDSSTNGTFVNEERVEGQRLLSRADVIRIGDENFRFYADTLVQAAPNPSPAPAANAPQAAPQAPSSASAGAGERLKHTVHAASGGPPPSAPRRSGTVLGNFLVRSGTLKGQRLIVKTPISNIGRADYNDLVLPDESVSTTHAKLQRREGVWVLVDLDSTNGTFVDGERLQGEAPLAPGAAVRFGDVTLVFEPTDDAAGVAKGGGTRMLEMMKPAAPPPAPPPPKAPSPPPPPAKAKAAPTKPKAAPKRPPVAEQKKGKGCGGSAAMLVLGIVGFVYWILV